MQGQDSRDGSGTVTSVPILAPRAINQANRNILSEHTIGEQRQQDTPERPVIGLPSATLSLVSTVVESQLSFELSKVKTGDSMSSPDVTLPPVNSPCPGYPSQAKSQPKLPYTLFGAPERQFWPIRMRADSLYPQDLTSLIQDLSNETGGTAYTLFKTYLYLPLPQPTLLNKVQLKWKPILKSEAKQILCLTFFEQSLAWK